MTRLRTPPRSLSERINQLADRADSLEKQLVQSQRLATLGTLSMTLVHELNNQLMAVINHADLALTSRQEEAMGRALEKILASSEMAASMIGNMLKFSRSGGSQAQAINGAQLVEGALGLMARKPAKDGIEVVRECDESIWVEGPPTELTQVLLNLVLNAVQAMDESGGTLTLRVRRQDSFAAIEVCDTGPGIAAEHMGAIFEPFFTTKPATDRHGGGTGLGLYISREIARKCGGDLAVTSRPGEGATFTLFLPTVEPQEE